MFINDSLKTDKRDKDLSFGSKTMDENESNVNNNQNHYHLGERNDSHINVMTGIRSLICDLNGIIIAEMVYRCLQCDHLFETIPEVQMHYQSKHIDEEYRNDSNSMKTSISTNTNANSAANVSFLGSFVSNNDINSDIKSESLATNTLTFDVPSGLKTLQQQFQPEKEIKKKNIKQFNTFSTSVNPKNKSVFTNKSKSQKVGSQTKSGFITCEICDATKFYKCLQRRFGVYSCVGCAKFYSKYLLKPIHYTCENLGKCNLKVSECQPNGRCKACLIHKCKSKFVIDQKKLSNTNAIKLLQSNAKKSFNDIKAKRNNKPNAGKDLSRTLKGKSSNSLALTLNKSKTTSEDDSLLSIKAPNVLISTKKVKSEKIDQKLTQKHDKKGISPKSSPNTNGIKKTIVTVKGKRNIFKSLKSNGVKNIKKPRQTSCRKCIGCKTKNCNNCVNCMDRPRNGGKDKIRQKCLKRKCLDLSRNNSIHKIK